MAFKNPIEQADSLKPGNPYNFNDRRSALGNLYTDFSQGDYSGQALVFQDPSKYGIDKGNISKLWLKYKGTPILNYDRGWDTKSGKYELDPQHEEFYKNLIAALSEYGKNRGAW